LGAITLNNKIMNNYQFDLPTHHKSIIKVIGVGGGGSNAVNHMYNLGIKDVEFVVCNTDSQALESSPVQQKLQIGVTLTSGLGAGANPERGRNAALESKEEIRELLHDTKMVFITAGMGGGTGTGAAPVIAQVAQELDILTVGIVTAPFAFEGKKKMMAADEGIRQMRQYCDTVLVIMNDKLREIFGNLSISEAFAHADNVLNTAAKGIAEIITVPGYVNVDFEDVKTVMRRAGRAVMGSAKTQGDNRARRAAEEALNSPLLNNEEIFGAERILLSIMSGPEAELQMDELTEITDYMQEFAGEEADVIFGHGIDPDLGEHIRVTVIATGYNPDVPKADVAQEPYLKKMVIEEEPKKEEPKPYKMEDPNTDEPVVFDLDSFEFDDDEMIAPDDHKKEPYLQPSLFNLNNMDDDEDEEEETRKPYSFDFIKAEIKKEIEEEEERQRKGFDFEFDIEGDFEDEAFNKKLEQEEDEDDKIDELLEGPAIPTSKKAQLMEERKRREEQLSGQKYEMKTEDFKEKLDVPAYERKKVALKDVPHSSERHVSRFNLTDDNQILGNNKFLHDNVD
jgi:cell division protein FtsZ